MKCDRCDRDSVVYIRYNGEHLCKEHFFDFLEKRVKHEIRKQVNIKKGDRIAVAVSGGKDSSVALYLMKKIFSVRKDVEIFAITVDEGIYGYRDRALNVLKDFVNVLDVPHYIYRMKDMIGYDVDEISNIDKELVPCTYCGVFRRKIINYAARELKANYVATGLNLDDTAQSIVMNIVRGDVERLMRLGPHDVIKEDLIPRIQPLRMIPEKEILLYAILKGIKFYHGECPYAPKALRNDFRSCIDSWESRNPGSRHSIISFYDEIKNNLQGKFPRTRLNRCRICGDPTTGEICKSCELKLRLDSLKD
ncbi:MAG: TIGR00269 family protein [Thermoplasmata archaeon]